MELGGYDPQTTNNRMEMLAALQALKAIVTEASSITNGMIQVHTDSKYLIQGMTEWLVNWKRRAWKTAEGKPVANQELWEELSTVVTSLSVSCQVQWIHVRGHSGIPGNERVDEIASSFAQKHPIELFDGLQKDYGIRMG